MRAIPCLSLLLALAGCGGAMTGRATVSETVPARSVSPPARISVGDFTAAADAVKGQGGLLGEAEELAAERPRILGGGILGEGPLRRRLGSDMPTADDVSEQLAAAIVSSLEAEHLGVPVGRLARGVPPPDGWLVHGRLLDVDPGNRVRRAVIGFGAGEATTEVAVDVDRVDGDRPARVLEIGGTSDSGRMPGAAVTMNPYVAAAKFVLGREATARDVRKLGAAVAKEIADQVRAARAR